MRTRPRILADIDGFFANFVDNALGVMHEITGRHAHMKHDDVNTYAMEVACGLSREEKAAWFARIRSPGYCAAIQPYPGARECLAELETLGDVYPVTYPFPGSPWWIIEREAWMRDVLGLDPDRVVYTRRKYTVAGDFLLEDTTEHLVKWRAHHPDGVGIRLARAYNRHEPFADGFTVTDYAGVVRVVRDALDLRDQGLAVWRSYLGEPST